VNGFELRPIDPERDLDLVHAWMNDPAVSRYWELAGDRASVRRYLCSQLGSAHSTPYLGVLDGEPMSYWELYRADLDRLASYYRARPYDAGVHLLFGPPAYRGRGLGAPLLRAVCAAQLAAWGRSSRVLAEPDVRNEASVRAFTRAGFRPVGEIELPEKRALLMALDRAALTAGDPEAGAAGGAGRSEAVA
jgi:RimJ/RimL family protein N-acetyltransferase